MTEAARVLRFERDERFDLIDQRPERLRQLFGALFRGARVTPSVSTASGGAPSGSACSHR